MQQIDMLKDFISGIFQKNYENSDIDDEDFFPLIKKGIESPSIKESPQIYKDVLEHAISEYVNCCVKGAIENGVTDLEQEKMDARKEFLKYYKRS